MEPFWRVTARAWRQNNVQIRTEHRIEHRPAAIRQRMRGQQSVRGRLRIMAGAFVSGETLVNAHRERARLSAIIAATLTDADLLMMPTRHIVSPILGDYDSAVDPSLTRPFNLTGYPALSVCNGLTSAGLPTSLQIGDRPFEDHLVLKAGDAFEKAAGFRKFRPALVAG
jgi:aspartyl-tRNA(Asn)/glutamyl-tRNA(Gln) amidotransferase subunit A